MSHQHKFSKYIAKSLAIIFFSFYTQGCAPVLITAVAAKSGMELAKDRSVGQTIDDVKISSSIKTKLMKAGFKELYANIKVTVMRGRVLYTGTVKSDQDVQRAIKIAWQQKDVISVANELKVNENASTFNAMEYASDSMITAKVKTGLLKAKKVKSRNLTIITTSKVVYIFGVASSQEERKEAASIASRVKGVKKVINYIDLIDEYGSVVDDSKEKDNNTK